MAGRVSAKEPPARKTASAQAHLGLSLLLRKQPISERDGDQWEARMSGPADLNAPRRKKVGAVGEGAGRLRPESGGSRLWCGHA